MKKFTCFMLALFVLSVTLVGCSKENTEPEGMIDPDGGTIPIVADPTMRDINISSDGGAFIVPIKDNIDWIVMEYGINENYTHENLIPQKYPIKWPTKEDWKGNTVYEAYYTIQGDWFTICKENKAYLRLVIDKNETNKKRELKVALGPLLFGDIVSVIQDK